MKETYADLLKAGVAQLQGEGIPDARIDAELLLLDIIGQTRSFLFVHQNDPCSPEEAGRYAQLLKRRMRGEPVQYITGSQDFMGLPFEVSPSVLIPRQDTETLVETAIEEMQGRKKLQILDMCCGSGAIAVSCAYYLADSCVTACDISPEALEITARNAERNGVSDRVICRQSDMFAFFREKDGETEESLFDMILSNPPYIPAGVIPTLQREIKEYEPWDALDGGGDGLAFYRILAREAWKYMKPGGLLLMEIGAEQAGAVSALLEQSGHYTGMEVIRDLAGRDRVVRAVQEVNINRKKLAQQMPV